MNDDASAFAWALDGLPGAFAWALDGLPGEVRARGRRLDPEQVQWLLPLARPGKLICLGLNYAAHAAEGGRATPDYPAFFMPQRQSCRRARAA